VLLKLSIADHLSQRRWQCSQAWSCSSKTLTSPKLVRIRGTTSVLCATHLHRCGLANCAVCQWRKQQTMNQSAYVCKKNLKADLQHGESAPFTQGVSGRAEILKQLSRSKVEVKHHQNNF